MNLILNCALAFGLAISFSCSQALAESLKDQHLFAAKVKEKLRAYQYDTAFTAMREYLDTVQDTAPVKRELALYSMKTKGERIDNLLDYKYPISDADIINGLPNEATEANPTEHEAWSLLVYTHTLQGNKDSGYAALEKTNTLENRADWLDYNSALLAISNNQIEHATDDVLFSLPIKGVRSYNVIHNGFHHYAWGGSKLTALKELLDNYDKTLSAIVKNKIRVAPRSEYLPDHIQRKHADYI